jgi:ABC-type sugar transport system ATPase subunit
MNEGRVEQLGSPREVYDRPVSEFVARFLEVRRLHDAYRYTTVYVTRCR